MKLIKALNNPIRLTIVQFILNSSHVSFTQIHNYTKEEHGELSKGTLSYHLDLLIEGDVLSKNLERGEGREYSNYDIKDDVVEKFKVLDLIESTITT